LLLLLLASAAIALTACGDGDGETTTSAEEAGEILSQDIEAQATVRTGLSAIEAYGGKRKGYEGATEEALAEVEPLLADKDVTVDKADKEDWELSVESESGVTFTLRRTAGGTVEYLCSPPGKGRCDAGGKWTGS
jgi:hypothetical protein